MTEKAVWDKKNVKHFCDICMREVNVGHRQLGHLNRVGWKNVVEKFEQKTGRKLEHLNSRINGMVSKEVILFLWS
jgi:hypothetical protein